jgi:asparagine synthase (glutamine-hydrolysing)
MSGILGYWNLDDRPVDPAIVSRMSSALRHRGPDGEGRRTAGAVALVQQHQWMTPEEVDESLPLVSTQGVWIVLDGRIDSRDELIDALGLPRDTSDARCVLAAYAKWGDGFAGKLNGDFALACYDPATRRMVLARDALGIRPLYYFRSDRLFAFASEIKALLAHPDIPTAPSMEGVADFMMIGVRPIDKQDVTCFEGVFSLVPAHLLVATPERTVTRRYWDFDGGLSVRLKSRDEYAEAFHERFVTAVRHRTRSRAGVAVSISGGFDSSSILCQALTLNRDRALCPAITGISYLGTEHTEADERRYLAMIESDFGIAIERFDMEPYLGLVDDAAEQVRAVEAPFVDYMWKITRHQHQQSAAAGARTFLTGHWGDQMLFSSAYLADLIGGLRLTEVWRHLNEYGRFYGRETVRILARIAAVDSARAFLPEAVLPMAKRLRRRVGRAPQRAPWFSERLRHFEQTSSDKPVKLPLDFHSVHARSIYLEARSKYHIQCMEWNNKAGALNGITCAFPFLDRDLVQFLMAVPGDVQNAGGVPRAMARDGMKGVMPDEIRARVWKGDPSALLNSGIREEAGAFTRALDHNSLAARMGFVDGERLATHVKGMLQAEGLQGCENSWRVADLFGLEAWLRVFFTSRT